ncbi:MAG: hypothetical protein JWN45_3513 [Acidobacteriaceae bacterium]|nr:hypothetical protein [Acidobacteriaceae bacterium]
MNEWDFLAEKPTPESVRVFGVDLKKGDKVRLWPKKGADILDLALKGQVATIESIEQDFDDNIHFAVLLDDDPGRDLGALRQPGHRFFFSPEEVEPLTEGAQSGAA